MAMEKITFGNNLPGYEFGPKTGPAVLVIQVRIPDRPKSSSSSPSSFSTPPASLLLVHNIIKYYSEISGGFTEDSTLPAWEP